MKIRDHNAEQNYLFYFVQEKGVKDRMIIPIPHMCETKLLSYKENINNPQKLQGAKQTAIVAKSG